MSVAEIAKAIRSHGSSLLAADTQPDAVVEACTTALRPHVLRTRRGDRLAAQLECLSNPVAVSRLHYGADVTITEVAPEQDEFIVAMPVAGLARFAYGRSTAVLQPGAMAVVSPYERFTLEIGRDFDQILLRLDRSKVEYAAAALVGSSAASPVHFAFAAYPLSPGVVGLLHAAAQLATDGALERQSRLAFQMEALLTDAFLLGCPNNLTARLVARDVRPSAERVTRAMDYMIDHLSEQIALSEVARHCGVTLRSLQVGFRREVAMTPGEWLRRERLERARARLAAADASETTVTSVAISCGFLHLGSFAARFRQAYGVSPSRVLREPR